jgi:hypothetical protein
MDKDLLILVGSGRSGTTYLTRVLRDTMDYGFSAEPKFIVKKLLNLEQFGNLEEDENFERLLKQIYNSHSFDVLRGAKGVPTNYEELKGHIEQRDFEHIIYGALDYISFKRGNTKRCFKDPNALRYISLLAETFPQSKFLHIYRDGRDVAKSTKNFNWGGNNIYVNAIEWAKYITLARKEGNKLGESRYLELKFEDMVINPENAANEIVKFLGEKEESKVQLFELFNKTLDSNKIYRWMSNYSEEDLKLFENVAGKELKEFGYDVKYKTAKLSSIKSTYFIIHDFVTRVKNVIKRKLKN